MPASFGALDIDVAVLAAPMAGGASSAALVISTSAAGGLGFLAGGYASVDALASQMSAVRRSTSRFGVNLFVPNPVPISEADYARYRESLAADAERFATTLPADRREDDDSWRDKIDLLVDEPVAVVSFTFGLPEPAAAKALRRAGSILVQTVTSVAEARRADDAGVDMIIVQGAGAGGHSGTWTPHRPIHEVPLPDVVARIGYETRRPIIAAGGIADADQVRAVRTAGAAAVMVGTALLLAPEAGTAPVHRAALCSDSAGDTVITRAFTGRPARALPNAFIAAHDRDAPAGYPAVHHLTSPLRKAAAAAGDGDFVHLWAGTGYRSARPQPVADTVAGLAAQL